MTGDGVLIGLLVVLAVFASIFVAGMATVWIIELIDRILRWRS